MCIYIYVWAVWVSGLPVSDALEADYLMVYIHVHCLVQGVYNFQKPLSLSLADSEVFSETPKA